MKKTKQQIYAERAAAREISYSRAANPLKLQDGDIEQYLPSILKKLPEKELRKEYSRLRHIALTRMKSMSTTKWAQTEAYKSHIGAFPALKEISSQTELLSTLYETARFVSAKSSSIKGNELIMYKTLATLHKNGYGFVTPENFIEFGRFMQIWRESSISRLLSSEEWAETYHDLEESGLGVKERTAEAIKREFEKWQGEQVMLDHQGGEPMTLFELKQEAASYGYGDSILELRKYLKATPLERQMHKKIHR